MKNKKIFKIIILFVIYLFYTTILNKLFTLCNIQISVNTLFVSDLIFFLFIILMYQNNLKNDFNQFKNDKQKKLRVIIIGVLALFLINLLIGIVTEAIFPNLSNLNDGNTSLVIELFNISYIYTLFKTLLFAPIAEELLFKEAIRDVVKNNVLFVLISSILYTTMNFIYASVECPYAILDIIGYFLFSTVLSIIYLKKQDNIIFVMFIKFFYNIIPTIILLISMVIV